VVDAETGTRACRSKRAHDTEARAERHRQRLIRGGAAPTAIETYACKHCSTKDAPRFHVGHVKNRMKWRKTS
jgi:hypothetical protein